LAGAPGGLSALFRVTPSRLAVSPLDQPTSACANAWRALEDRKCSRGLFELPQQLVGERTIGGLVPAG
jgi:hypothetical protein